MGSYSLLFPHKKTHSTCFIVSHPKCNRYQEAFAVSPEFAKFHCHLNSIRGLHTNDESPTKKGHSLNLSDDDDDDDDDDEDSQGSIDSKDSDL